MVSRIIDYIKTQGRLKISHRAWLYALEAWINAFVDDSIQCSLFWCKLRATIGETLSLILFFTLGLTTSDQFLSTSHRRNLRRLSTFKLTRQLILINIMMWSFHGISTLIFFKIQSSLDSSIYYQIYGQYYSIGYFYILLGYLPMSIMTIFSILAVLNVRKIIRTPIPIERRWRDRQLTSMVLIPLTLPMSCIVLVHSVTNILMMFN
ncbi:unnamed protein product [Rotaria sp. Silwood1]|nr:unnamed protein product [Rotaria sp. Silwood1]